MKSILTIFAILPLIFLSGCTTTQPVQAGPDRGLFEINGASNISYSAPVTKTTTYDDSGRVKTVVEQAQIATTTTTRPDGTKIVEEKPMTVGVFIKDTTPKPIPETPLQTCVNGLLGITKLGLAYEGIRTVGDIATKPAQVVQPQVVQVEPTIVEPTIIEVPASQ